MNLIILSWKNLRSKPLNTSLSLILFALGVGLISLLFLLEDQLQKNFEKNLAGIDLVIGAKGSPLQMILSSMYHIDAPTGNISLDQIKPFLNPKHPLIEGALPMSLGDSYRGYRIVGTTDDIAAWYELTMSEGAFYNRDFEVVLGASAARDLNLYLGDRFKSSHGLVDDDGLEHEDADDFNVVGILQPSGTIIDQLILTTPQTYWHVHDAGGTKKEDIEISHDATEQEHDDHHDHQHDHQHKHEEDLSELSHATLKKLATEDSDNSITNLLLRFKGRSFQALNMQRSINENTEMQAATPAIEITRLFTMMDGAERALRILGFVIILVSGLSIFISLYSSLQDRKYELSLMRVMGGAKSTLFSLIILEGLILALMGYIMGMILSHVGMSIIGRFMKDDYRYDFTGWYMLPSEGWLLVGALILGLVASFIPAIQASRTDISETLSRG